MSDQFENSLIKAYRDANRFGEFLGMDFEIKEPGKVSYKLLIKEDHLATPHAVHGGVIAALCDALLGVGALSFVSASNKVVATIEMKVSFLNPVKTGDLLIGESSIVRAGQKIIFMEGRIANQDGHLVATASGTFNIYPAEKAGY
jgi:uncharacterized protein (TIGR00369 family)